MRQLFGTDGIRGVAGEYPLDSRTTFAVGVALGEWISSAHLDPEVVIGVDTRESGPEIASFVAGGLASKGVRARFAGLITTPGIAFITRSGSFAAGVMISASHNPFQDNGIKVLAHNGFKLPDDEEHAIEQKVFACLESGAQATAVGLTPDPSLDAQYEDYLASTFTGRLDGWSMVVDGSHGSASYLAPELFSRLGAKVISIGCAPDGRNINLNCGSLHLDCLRDRVLEEGADVGVAFDGDADRALFVSKSGRIVDGDAVMWITGLHLARQGRLNEADGHPAIVGTVMSNLGLEVALRKQGIELIRTPVGDKYVLEEMVRRGAMLGGEQSGHIIFREFATTGDGMLTALRVFDAVTSSGRSLDELASEFPVFPQLLVNVKIRERKKLEEMATVQNEIRAAETSFNGEGRVLVRFSGTEPLARVMVEGPDEERVNGFAHRIADAIRTEIGAQ
jgi:phosphoglucosamine mutase